MPGPRDVGRRVEDRPEEALEDRVLAPGRQRRRRGPTRRCAPARAAAPRSCTDPRARSAAAARAAARRDARSRRDRSRAPVELRVRCSANRTRRSLAPSIRWPRCTRCTNAASATTVSATSRATSRIEAPGQRPARSAGGVIAAPASRPQPIATAFSATSASSPTRAGRNHWNASSPMPVDQRRERRRDDRRGVGPIAPHPQEQPGDDAELDEVDALDGADRRVGAAGRGGVGPGDGERRRQRAVAQRPVRPDARQRHADRGEHGQARPPSIRRLNVPGNAARSADRALPIAGAARTSAIDAAIAIEQRPPAAAW